MARAHVRDLARIPGICPDRAAVPVRDILTAVLRHDGAAFGLAHNHPDCDPTLSTTDIESTGRLYAGASAIGLTLLEHIVVTDNTWRTIRSIGR